MTIYVDSSALLKVYFDEPDTDAAAEMLLSDPHWITGRHTSIEVRRNLSNELSGADAVAAREQFARHWETITVVELDRVVCDAAIEIAEVTGLRTLDALHLGALQRVGGGTLPLLTYDLRQAQAARSLGWTVLGS